MQCLFPSSHIQLSYSDLVAKILETMKLNRSTTDDSPPIEYKSPMRHSTHRNAPLRQILIYTSLILVGAGGAVAGNRLLAQDPSSVAQQTTPQATPSPDNAPETVAPINPTRPTPLSAENPNFIAEAVQRVGPAVVRIDSQRTVTTRFPGQSRDPFGFPFGGEIPNRPPEQIEEGTGSGFIIDANGLILTNAHVIDGADRVTVVLTDGRSFEGEVLGQDLVTDVAVIKIEATDLPTVTIGNSDQLQPGQWAIAIGNPLGLDNTVTVGIISATGRSSADIGVSDRRVGFIQTDAAINPGNSGGPLLNERGEVIGMNTAIISGAQGLGFSVPINTVREIADQLIADGRVEHPYLGIQMAALTPEIKQQLNSDPNNGITVQEDRGVLILGVVPNSPAAQAGLRTGDVIVRLGNQPVEDAESVQRVVEGSEIGGRLPVEIRREGQTLNLSVEPGVLPDEFLG